MIDCQNYWHWFRQNELLLAKRGGAHSLWHTLDDRLALIDSRLDWEMGPTNDSPDLYFAVSPAFDPQVLPIAQVVIDSAYRSAYWDFRIGKQRRPWTGTIQLGPSAALGTDEFMLEEYDVSAWRHIVYRVPGSERLDIVIECGVQFPAVGDRLDALGTVVVSSLIGELTIIQKVGEIEIAEKFSEKEDRKAKPIDWLPYAFAMRPL